MEVENGPADHVRDRPGTLELYVGCLQAYLRQVEPVGLGSEVRFHTERHIPCDPEQRAVSLDLGRVAEIDPKPEIPEIPIGTGPEEGVELTTPNLIGRGQPRPDRGEILAAASIWAAPGDFKPVIRTFWSPEITVPGSAGSLGNRAADSTLSSSLEGSWCCSLCSACEGRRSCCR